jgi:RHS repeat-associated protein
MSESATDADEPFAVDTHTLGSLASRSDAIDPPPASERVEYYHLDTLGSVRVVTDAHGQVVARHDFLPFGEEWSSAGGGPGTNPVDQRLFTGQERDAELDLGYFGARYYRANLGRFTTVDPALDIDKAIAEPQRWNRYAYVTNNPLKYVDPDGRELKWATSLSTSDRERLVKILVDVVRREEGRALVERLAADSQVVEIGARSVGDDSGSGGVTKTLGVINLKGSDLAITIDLGKISGIDPGQDPVHAGGTTTMAHELYHANSFISAPSDGTSRWLFVAAGDKPSSATGPAEKWAVGLFQAPKVIKKKEAEQIVNELIK